MSDIDWGSLPPAIRHSMIGAKKFLHVSLLKVPWTWRLTVCPVSDEHPEQIRAYGRNVRTMLNVTSPPSNKLTLDTPLNPP
jgi:hypothetical protein